MNDYKMFVADRYYASLLFFIINALDSHQSSICKNIARRDETQIKIKEKLQLVREKLSTNNSLLILPSILNLDGKHKDFF